MHSILASLFIPFTIATSTCDIQSAISACSPGDSLILRLPPSQFSGLPITIRDFLEENGYSIPQCWCDTTPHNVLSGNFVKPGQLDWAVLASKNGSSSVLVFHNGSTSQIDTLQTEPDEIYLQGVGLPKMAYSRAISVVEQGFIDEHAEWYEGPKPPPIDHQGIDDAFVEKASSVHYYYQGKWLELAGSD